MFQRFICIKFTENYQTYASDSPPPFQYSNNARTPPGKIFLFRASYLSICKIYLRCMTGKERVSTWDHFENCMFCYIYYTKQKRCAIDSFCNISLVVLTKYNVWVTWNILCFPFLYSAPKKYLSGNWKRIWYNSLTKICYII